MRKLLLKIAKKFLPKSFREKLVDSQFNNKIEFSNKSFSQEGEDLILDRFFNYKKSGFYIDVGAHHPRKFSNTHIFYARGWRGINIDALPNSMDLFNSERPGDINLEVGVSKNGGELTYFMFNQPAINTFSEKEAKAKEAIERYQLREKVKVKTAPLKDLLDKHLPQQTKIDFISIDVEGLDVEVIQSNDWDLYRPTMILVEDLHKLSLVDIPEQSQIFKELTGRDYEL
ncbi:MAG TPA: FkbM family methyltransferase, partial [Flavobacteriaceae bacterium]|nr:FkbM family methyltransferase [Flavobacteriaceae bacterium]